jgi:signal peptidase I
VSGSAIAAVVLGLLFPGVGQGLAGHRLRGVLWAACALALTWLIVVSVWFLPITLVVRLACAVDAYRCLRHATREALVSAGIALVIGVVAIGGAQAALEAYKIPSSSMYPTLVIGDHVYIDKLSVRWSAPERGEIIVFDQPCAHRAYIKRVIGVAGDTIEVRCSVVYVNGKAVPASLVTANDKYEDRVEGYDWKTYEAARYREALGARSYDTFRNREDTNRGDFPQLDRMLAPSCTQSDFFRDGPQSENKQPQGRIIVTKPGAAPCEVQAHFVVPAHSLFVMGDNRHNANDSRFWGVVPLENVTGRAIGIYLSDGPAGGWGRFGAIE